MYIYVYMYILYIYMCIFIHISLERKRETERIGPPTPWFEGFRQVLATATTVEFYGIYALLYTTPIPRQGPNQGIFEEYLDLVLGWGWYKWGYLESL